MAVTTRGGRVALVVPRLGRALLDAGVGRQVGRILSWSVRSREIANFTYETTRESQLLMAATVAAASGRSMAEVVGYLDELNGDRALAQHVSTVGAAAEDRWSRDPGFKPGRRIALYLAARAIKPRRVVEAGVDRGLGAVLLCAALRRNELEGAPGDYVGIEFDAGKDIALYERYPEKVGRIVRGDSVDVLTRDPGRDLGPIDLFIHDTTSAADHMVAQLGLLPERMASRGVVVSTWTTPELVQFALERGLGLLTHQEETIGHWFPGDRIAFVHGFGMASEGPLAVPSAVEGSAP